MSECEYIQRDTGLSSRNFSIFLFSSSQNVTFPDDVESVAMSGYSDYLMSASSSIADIVNSASTAAASAAGQVAYQVSQIVIITSFLYECRLLSVDDVTTITHCFVKVSDACHSVAQSAQQKFLSYKYEPGKASGRVLTSLTCLHLCQAQINLK